MNNDLLITNVSQEELERRLLELAKSKSRAELINRLLISLSSVTGLDNVLQHILNILMQTIGADNISLVFRLDDSWQYRDIYGISKTYNETDNPAIDAVLASKKSQRSKCSPLDGTEFMAGDCVAMENWCFPLLVQERKIGVVCMEGMQLTDKSIFDELLPFFVYASIMLDNEISNYSRLAEAHQRSQDSEALYRTLFERSPDGIIVWKLPELTAVQFNSIAHTQLGYSRAEFAALRVPDIHVSVDPKEIERKIKQLQHDDFVRFEATHLTKSGQRRINLVTLKQLEVAGQQMVLAIHRDISERKEAEQRMALLTYALDHIHEAVYLIDKTAQIKYVNAEACRELGYSSEELIRLDVPAVSPDFPLAVWPEHWQELQQEGSLKFESFHQRKDGSRFPVEIIANHFMYNQSGYNLAMVRDISEQKRNEEARLKFEKQLLQTQKLESLGVLAGGIAHDFNNLLAAIMGHAELGKRRLNPESPAIDNLKQIEQSAERAADLAKQMLAYSGKGKFVIERINLNRLLEEMLHMLEVSISKNVLLRFDPYLSLPSVEADATQLRQIIMNLVINSSEAIGKKSGIISITTGCMDCDQSYLKDVWLTENLDDGLYVYLEIADSGCGMGKQTLTKLFDPFFTTKFTGRGLGMSAVLGIVRGHKGAIKVYSEVGKGTTFKILLPAVDSPADIFNGESQHEDWSGTGKVLLVDDEETVRGIGIAMLKELGFTPLTANDGRQAVDVYRANPDITLVILDLTMPKMDGEQCYRELRQLNPDIKVIMSSGYNEHEVTQKFVGKRLAGFIQKPYKLSALLEAIRKAGERNNTK